MRLFLVLLLFAVMQAKHWPSANSTHMKFEYHSRGPNAHFTRVFYNEISTDKPKKLRFRSTTVVPVLNDDTSGEDDSLEVPAEIVMYCEPEEFEHYCIGEDKLGKIKNIWKRGRASESVGLQKVCLKRNGLPVTRSCRLLTDDSNGPLGVWEQIDDWPVVRCLCHMRENVNSDKLNELHDNLLNSTYLPEGGTSDGEVVSRMSTILKESNHKLLPVDVLLTSRIMKELTTRGTDPDLSPDMVGICGTLMAGEQHVLRISAELNATNQLLENFETYMDAVAQSMVPSKLCGMPTATLSTTTAQHTVEVINLAHIGVRGHLSPNISVFYVNPRCANITGVAIFDLNPTAANSVHKMTHAHFAYRFVYMNETAEALKAETGLQVAAFLPQSLWQHVLAHQRRRRPPPVIVLKVYSHDGLFIERSLVSTRKPNSKILSISIPGFHEQFPENLPFLLRNEHLHNADPSNQAVGTSCGFWNYDSWVSTGVETEPEAQTESDPVVLCGTTHLTQFSFLLGGNYKQLDVSGDVLITPLNQRVLDVISLVGCSLSLLGLCVIWLTAGISANWRALPSTKILLNLCVALTLQMVLFVFVNTDNMSEYLVSNKSYLPCVALGALMQYSILVLFSWMLIIAILQFQRYVTVIGIERPRHYILKSAIAAWCFPLIPTLLVACIDPHSYIPRNFQLLTDSAVCYPSGHALTFGVVLPVALIVLANLVIFLYVFYSISHSLNQVERRNERQMITQQVRLSVLLFFLLGLSWIFGIFAFMRAGVVFSYLFCLTATLQGFVLCIYFVLLDEVARTAWKHLLFPKLNNSHKKSQQWKSSETHSMTTSHLESGLRT